MVRCIYKYLINLIVASSLHFPPLIQHDCKFWHPCPPQPPSLPGSHLLVIPLIPCRLSSSRWLQPRAIGSTPASMSCMHHVSTTVRSCEHCPSSETPVSVTPIAPVTSSTWKRRKTYSMMCTIWRMECL